MFRVQDVSMSVWEFWFQERPLIGEEVGGGKTEIVLEWLVETYSGTWKDWKEGGKKGDTHTHTLLLLTVTKVVLYLSLYIHNCNTHYIFHLTTFI